MLILHFKMAQLNKVDETQNYYENIIKLSEKISACH